MPLSMSSISEKSVHFHCHPFLLFVLSLSHLHYLRLFLLLFTFLLLIYLLPPGLFRLLFLHWCLLRFIRLLRTLLFFHVWRELLAQSWEHFIYLFLICHWLWFSLTYNVFEISLFFVRFFANHQFGEITFVFKAEVRFCCKSYDLIFLLDFLKLFFHFPLFF